MAIKTRLSEQNVIVYDDSLPTEEQNLGIAVVHYEHI